MALRGYELILFVRAQNQASATLRRVANDVRALGKVTDLQEKAQRLATAKKGSLLREADLRRKIASYDPGGKGMAGIEKRKRDLMESQRVIHENIRGIESDRQTISENIARTQERSDLRHAQLQNMSNLHAENALKFEEKKISLGKKKARLLAKEELTQLDAMDLKNVTKRLENLPRVEERVRRGIEQTAASHAKAMSDADRDVTRWQRALDKIPGKLRKQNNALAEIPHKEEAIRHAVEDTTHARQTAVNQLEKQIGTTKRLTQEELDNARAIKQQGIERKALMGRTVSHVGRTMQFGGIIATALAGGAASAAADFDTLVTQAATQARDIGGSYEQIGQRAEITKQAILEMMQVFPATSEEMGQAAYDIFSSMDLMNGKVFDVQAGLKVLALANKVAVAGQDDLKDATSGLITIFNNFDPQMQNVQGTLDSVFTIVRFGRMQLADFNQMMIKIAPAAAGAGQSLDDMAAAMAFLTTKIPTQRGVATGLSRLVQQFSHPDFIKGLRRMGVEITKDGKALLPFNDVLARIVARFPELTKGGLSLTNLARVVTGIGRAKLQFFDTKGNVKDIDTIIKQIKSGKIELPPASRGLVGTEEGRRAIQQLLIHYKEFVKFQDIVSNKNGAFKKQLDAMMDTPAVKWKIFQNQVRALILVIGAAAIPVFAKLGEWIQKVLNWLDGLGKETRDNIVKWGVWAAVGAVVVGTLLSVGGALIALRANLALAGGAGSIFMGLLKFLPFVALGFILIKAEVVNVKDAILIAGLAWAVFRSGGIVAATAVALAHRIAAKEVQVAWRAAMASTVWGLLIVAAGFALEWVMTHMQQVTPVWAGVSAALPIIWANAMQVIKQLTDDAVIYIAQSFHRILGRIGEALSGIAGFAGDAGKLLQGVAGLGEVISGQFTASLDVPQNVTGAYNKAYAASVAEMAKQGKKGKKATNWLADYNKLVKMSNKEIREKLGKDVFDQYQQLQDLLNGVGDGGGNAAKGIDEAKQAADAFADKVNEVADALLAKFKELEAVNRTIMGELFQGPWLGGRYGEEMDEWGIKPTIQGLTKDMKQQLAKFRQFRNAIGKLRARGAPPTLIQALMAMGPEAIDEVNAIANAPKAAYGQFIKAYTAREAEIKKATMVDFTDQLNQWKKYGGNIIDNILSGLSLEDHKLKNYFRNLVSTMFGPEVRAVIARELASGGGGGGGGGGAKPKEPRRPGRPDPRYLTPAKQIPQPPQHHGVPVEINNTTNISVVATSKESAAATGRKAAKQWLDAERKRRQEEAKDWGLAPKPGDNPPRSSKPSKPKPVTHRAPK